MIHSLDHSGKCFNTQPPEGGCQAFNRQDCCDQVSTHSRPKAAAKEQLPEIKAMYVSTHSRPKAAAGRVGGVCRMGGVSTHSRPKAAA